MINSRFIILVLDPVLVVSFYYSVGMWFGTVWDGILSIGTVWDTILVLYDMGCTRWFRPIWHSRDQMIINNFSLHFIGLKCTWAFPSFFVCNEVPLSIIFSIVVLCVCSIYLFVYLFYCVHVGMDSTEEAASIYLKKELENKMKLLKYKVSAWPEKYFVSVLVYFLTSHATCSPSCLSMAFLLTAHRHTICNCTSAMSFAKYGTWHLCLLKFQVTSLILIIWKLYLIHDSFF